MTHPEHRRAPAGRMGALVGTAFVLALAIAGLPQPAAGAGRKPPQTTGALHGTIAVHGCSIDAGDLLVRARPMDVTPNPAFRSPPGGARSFVTHALPSASTGARNGDFTFVFDGLATGVPYRVGVKLVGDSQRRCPRLAWDVDRDPLVIADDAPLVFAAFAVPSEFEVLGSAQGRDRETWVGGDAVDFMDTARATRQFRWRTTIPGATGGELQISLVPFPRIGNRAGPCSRDDPGVIKRVAFAAVPGEWAMPAAIDFNALLYPSRAGAGDAAIAGLDPDVGGIDPGALEKVELGRPLYLRVVPTNADGPICDPDVAGLPAEVRLARLLQALLSSPTVAEPRLEVFQVSYKTPEFDLHHPTPNEVCYRVTQRHDVPTTLGIPSPNLTFFSSWEFLAIDKLAYDSSALTFYVPDGAQFCSCTNCNDEGWFESFTDTFGSIITGLVDAVAKLVNEASDLWQKVQTVAVGAVVAGLKDLGVDCEKTCKDALATGLEIGLATMGVPPSLPNFDDLVDQGFDYLAAQAMSEIGVPPEIADYASDQLSEKGQKFMNQSIADMKGTPYSIPKLPNWLVPDLRFDRAYLTLELYGQGTTDAQAFSTRPGLILNNDPIYGGVFVKLPRKIPSKTSLPPPFLVSPLRFPLVLEPNLEGLPTAPANYDAYNTARVDKNNWLNMRYKNGCYHLYLTALVPDPADIFNVFAANFRTEDGKIACGP